MVLFPAPAGPSMATIILGPWLGEIARGFRPRSSRSAYPRFFDRCLLGSGKSVARSVSRFCGCCSGPACGASARRCARRFWVPGLAPGLLAGARLAAGLALFLTRASMRSLPRAWMRVSTQVVKQTLPPACRWPRARCAGPAPRPASPCARRWQESHSACYGRYHFRCHARSSPCRAPSAPALRGGNCHGGVRSLLRDAPPSHAALCGALMQACDSAREPA